MGAGVSSLTGSCLRAAAVMPGMTQMPSPPPLPLPLPTLLPCPPAPPRPTAAPRPTSCRAMSRACACATRTKLSSMRT